MPEIYPVTPAHFANKAWSREADYLFSAKDNLCPIVDIELAKAAPCFPIAFMENKGKYLPVAVQGLQQKENLLINDKGQWLAPYIPAAYRGYPFLFARSKTDQLVLCFDSGSGRLVDEEEGNPFFSADEATTELSKVQKFLSVIEAARKRTEVLCQTLVKHELIVPWELEVKRGGRRNRLEGLFHVDEQALRELSADAYGELARLDAIKLCYCQLLSEQKIALLETLSALRKQSVSREKIAELDIGLADEELLDFSKL